MLIDCMRARRLKVHRPPLLCVSASSTGSCLLSLGGAHRTRMGRPRGHGGRPPFMLQAATFFAAVGISLGRQSGREGSQTSSSGCERKETWEDCIFAAESRLRSGHGTRSMVGERWTKDERPPQLAQCHGRAADKEAAPAAATRRPPQRLCEPQEGRPSGSATGLTAAGRLT